MPFTPDAAAAAGRRARARHGARDRRRRHRPRAGLARRRRAERLAAERLRERPAVRHRQRRRALGAARRGRRAGAARACSALLRGADVFYANRRQRLSRPLWPVAAAGRRASGPASCTPASACTASAGRGPIAPGFDQSAGCVTGVMTLEGHAQRAEAAADPGGQRLPGLVAADDRHRRSADAARARRRQLARARVADAAVAVALLARACSTSAMRTRPPAAARRTRTSTPTSSRPTRRCGRYQGVTDQVRCRPRRALPRRCWCRGVVAGGVAGVGSVESDLAMLYRLA